MIGTALALKLTDLLDDSRYIQSRSVTVGTYDAIIRVFPKFWKDPNRQ